MKIATCAVCSPAPALTDASSSLTSDTAFSLSIFAIFFFELTSSHHLSLSSDSRFLAWRFSDSNSFSSLRLRFARSST